MTKRRVLFTLLITLLCCFALVHAEETEEKKLPLGFIRITSSTQQGWLPLPLTEEYDYPFVQVLDDGTQAQNVIHLMTNGFYMESSDCDNQDCVEEGIVTLENRGSRVLANAVICLPHQVCVELFSLEEVLQMMGASL